MPKLFYNGDRISVGEAAKMLSMNEAKVKKFMREGKLPIGLVEEPDKDGGCGGYYIYKSRVEAYLNGFDINILSVLLKSLNMDTTE